MYFQRTTTVNVRIDQNTSNRPVNHAPTNWNNVFDRLATLPRSDKDIIRQQQRRKIIESVALQLNQDIPSDDDSFQRSHILSSTPVISSPRKGRVPQIHAPPRISVIPKRTPLRSNAALMNISTPRSNNKRKTSTPLKEKSAKKHKKSPVATFTAPPIPPTPVNNSVMNGMPPIKLINPRNYYESFSNFNSPYNSPYTPNTIKNLDQQRTMYASRMTINQTNFYQNKTAQERSLYVNNNQRGDLFHASTSNKSTSSASPIIEEAESEEEEEKRSQENIEDKDHVEEDEAEKKEEEFEKVQQLREESFSSAVSVAQPKWCASKVDSTISHIFHDEPLHKSLVNYDMSQEKSNNDADHEEDEVVEEAEEFDDVQQLREESFSSALSVEQPKWCASKADSPISHIFHDEPLQKSLVNYDMSQEKSNNDEDEEFEEDGTRDAHQVTQKEETMFHNKEQEFSSVEEGEADKEDEADEEDEEDDEDEEDVESASTPVFSDKKCIKSLVAYNVTQEENEFSENEGENKEHEETLQNDTNDQDVVASLGSNQYDSENDLNEQYLEEDENDNSGSPIHQDLVSEDEEEEEEEHVNNQNQEDFDVDQVQEDQDEVQEDDYHNHYESYVDTDKEPHISSEVYVASPASQGMYNESFQVDDSDDDSAQPESDPELETEAPKIVKRKKLSRDSLKRRILANLDEGRRLDEIIRPVDNTQARIYRRSKRNRVRPLNYWSGQRALYKYEVDLKGNPVSTLVGVSTESMEPRRPMRVRSVKKKRVEREENNFRMSNILDLSIHNVKLAKRLKDIDTEAVIPYSNIDFKESGKSVGVFTAITKKISNGAFGKLKFSPNAEKKMTKTGQYVTYFNVIYGTLLFKIEGEKKGALVKTGFSFQVNQDTNYSISNLRNDESIVDFTIIKDSP